MLPTNLCAECTTKTKAMAMLITYEWRCFVTTLEILREYPPQATLWHYTWKGASSKQAYGFQPTNRWCLFQTPACMDGPRQTTSLFQCGGHYLWRKKCFNFMLNAPAKLHVHHASARKQNWKVHACANANVLFRKWNFVTLWIWIIINDIVRGMQTVWWNGNKQFHSLIRFIY